MDNVQTEILTNKELAEYTEISKSTLYKLVKKGLSKDSKQLMGYNQVMMRTGGVNYIEC